jgi:hypothetical protein
MKYVFLFCSSRDDQAVWESMSPEQAAEAYGRVGKWFEDNGEKIAGGYELQGPDTATTVRFGPNGDTLVTDGPFVEANEVIGGYAEVEVENLDEALRMAKSWPGGGPVEIRPVVAR